MELIVCKVCGVNKHNPKYKQCYECSGVKAVANVTGCERHKNNPAPSVCSDCLKIKKEFFSKNKAYIK